MRDGGSLRRGGGVSRWAAGVRAIVVVACLAPWANTSFAAQLSPEPPRSTLTARATHSPSAGAPVPSNAPVPSSALEPSGAPEPSFASPPSGVRACDYVPGASVAQMPDEVLHPDAPTPTPRPSPPTNSAVDAAVTARQLGLLDELWGAVKSDYVFADYNGLDWDAVRTQYRTVVSDGLTDADFYTLMNQLIAELGDQHSYYLDPDEARKAEQVEGGTEHLVGIGVYIAADPAPDGLAVVLTFPGGAAETGGIRAHDVLTAVDGKPVLDKNGKPTATAGLLAGAPGTTLVATIRHPDGSMEDLSLVRREFAGATPVPFCRVPGTRIGYVLLATLYEKPMIDSLRAALQLMSADGPLDGLIIDNRENGGGLGSVLVPILSMFMDGRLGFFAGRKILYPLQSTPEDVAGSQSLPLAVLVGSGTNSFGEVMSGVLQQSDGAITVGQTTRGNVEVLRKHVFSDDSQAWIAQELFVPVQTRYGPWDKTGIRADISAPTRWDLYSEANDPGLATAVAALQGR